VEFALLLPIFLLLVLGVIEFGRALLTYQTMTDASREGARTAAVADPTQTPASVIARVNTSLAIAGIDTAAATKQLTIRSQATGTDVWPGARGDTVYMYIEIPYQFGLLQPFVQLLAGGPFTLKTASKFRNE